MEGVALARSERFEEEPRRRLSRLSLECATCGYGVARSTPPERCPMCQADALWIHAQARRRPRAQLVP
jgi:rubrerythrin